MGRTKALLPLPGGDCFLARLGATLRAAGMEDVVAVIGHDVDAIRAAVAMAGMPLRLVENADPSRGQLSSLLVGLDALCRGGGAGVPTAVLVTPVDLPLVSADTVRRVIAAWQATRAPIVRPERAGRHGHPVMFGASVFDELRAADLRGGARSVVRAHHAEIVNVVVDDDGAFEDIDTPGDYDRLVRQS
jgi:molybdenum cofactor cytidylyltransferase